MCSDVQERQVQASLCRLEQGVHIEGKNCGSGKQVIVGAPGACKSANRGTVTPTQAAPEKRNNVIVARMGDELLTDFYDAMFARHKVYFGTDGKDK